MGILISDACIRCGACVQDCPRGCLKQTPDGISAEPEMCNLCGHCIAICPANAVSCAEYDMKQVHTVKPKERTVDADPLLELMRFRRSIRRYEKRPVEQEKLDYIIEAGRYAPTACNFQRNRFIVVRDKLPELRRLIIKQLFQEAQHILSETDDPLLIFRAKLWIQIYDAYQAHPAGEDRLFFHAPAVIALVSPDIRDGGIAASYMELMAAALGLGSLYSGYISYGINTSREAQRLLGLAQEEQVVIALLLGYPDVHYVRTAPKAPAQLTLL